MSKPPRRALRPSVIALEGRALLAGPSATWVGQDLHDLVGQTFAPGGNGVQDIHIALTDLPGEKRIVHLVVSGLGGGEWQYRGSPGTWAVGLERGAGETTAEVYVDPYQVENGRPFYLSWTYSDGSKDDAWASGGAADPNLRMPSSSARLAWIGQDGVDLVGLGPSVGPDGFQDIHLVLSNLTPSVGIDAATITSSSGLAWGFGTNQAGLNNAVLSRRANDPSIAELRIAAPGDLSGQTLTVTFVYANGKLDSATVGAGSSSATLAQTSTAGPMPTLRAGLTAAWVGQIGSDLGGPGWARLAISGLPAGRTVVAAAVSDPVRGLWTYKSADGAGVYFDSWSNPLAVRVSGTTATFAFPPNRNENRSTLTARVVFDDGSMAIAQVVAGPTDPGLLSPDIASTSIVAQPGNDLNTLANSYGTVRLSPGVYDLAQPLVLNHAVAILADPGAVLLFSQAPGDPEWTTAIKVHSGHTTLDGFAIRFATPIRWASGVSYGPAVIGTTDNLDTSGGTLKAKLEFTGLDIESPPVAAGASPVEAPRLFRLTASLDGLIARNRLKGGTVEVLGGPWTIVDNVYLGTVPNTYSWTAFAGHSTHDLILQRNMASPVGPSGRTWRFLVLTGTGDGDLVSENAVVGIGPRDGDAEATNAAEIILTESYSVQFEGTPSAISGDRRIVQIPTPQGEPAKTGDVIAILSGSSAGQYRRVVQALGPQTYLVDAAMPSGSYPISIVSGFVNETFVGNFVDSRGSAAAGNMVFVGNHFGTTVANNHLLGGAQSLHVTAAPTERPVVWGWSHAPFLNATISGNVFEDSVWGTTLAVEHAAVIKSNAGRVYFSGSLASNTVVWSSSFLAAQPAGRTPGGIVVGSPGALDPGELVLSTFGNGATVPAGSARPSLKIVSGTIDGQSVRDDVRMLGDGDVPPPIGAPGGLSLVNDTGLSAVDRDTTDGRTMFAAVAGAVSYEWRLSSDPSFRPLAKAGPFLPTGLVQGSNTVIVRAVDASGRRSAESSYQFRLDNSPPRTSIPFIRPQDDTGFSALDRITRATRPGFNVTGDFNDTMVLLRDGQEVGRVIGPGVLIDPIALPDGTYNYSLLRIDAAGNASQSGSEAITIDTTAPAAVTRLTIASNGVATFTGAGGNRHEYRLGASGSFVPLDGRTAFTASVSVPVGVRAIDAAGNVGAETWVTYAPSGSIPVAPPVTSPPKAPQTPKEKRAARAAERAARRAKLLAARRARLLAAQQAR